MTGPQEPEVRFNWRPIWVLVLMLAACFNLAWAGWGWDADKLVIAILFMCVATLTRTVGIYRQQLGLEQGPGR